MNSLKIEGNFRQIVADAEGLGSLNDMIRLGSIYCSYCFVGAIHTFSHKVDDMHLI